MIPDPASRASVGVFALSASVSIGAYWAGLRNAVRRALLVAAAWFLVSTVLWEITIDQVDWAWTYFGELLIAHLVASGIPAVVAFNLARHHSVLARGHSVLIRWGGVLGRVLLIALAVLILAYPAAVVTGCLLDSRCYL